MSLAGMPLSSWVVAPCGLTRRWSRIPQLRPLHHVALPSGPHQPVPTTTSHSKPTRTNQLTQKILLHAYRACRIRSTFGPNAFSVGVAGGIG